jgi:hypothetical protein
VRSSLVLLLAAAAFATVAPAAPVPREADRPPVYFPTRVGDTWVWGWVGDKTEFTEVVTEVESKEGAKVITVETMAEGTPLSPEKYSAIETYSLTERGLFRLSHGDQRYEKPWCVLKAPYRAGEKWEVDVKDHFGVGGKSSHTIGEFEWVEVPAGKFWALRVETVHAGEKPPLTATSWYARGIGQVKMVARSRAGKEEGAVVLKSFTPGK